MKKVNVEEAIGMVLCHDMTQIIPGKLKDAKFRKGHVIKEEDMRLVYLLEVKEPNLLSEKVLQSV